MRARHAATALAAVVLVGGLVVAGAHLRPEAAGATDADGPATCRCENGSPCVTTQSATATVTAGYLGYSVGVGADGATVRLGRVRTVPAPSTVTGRMAVGVTDTRGCSRGWTLTGDLTDVTDGSHVIPRSSVTTSPTCRARSAASAPGATSGPPGQSYAGTVLLCAKDARLGGSGSTGGVYDVGASVTLHVPPSQPAGSYRATLTVTLA